MCIKLREFYKNCDPNVKKVSIAYMPHRVPAICSALSRFSFLRDFYGPSTLMK